MKPSITIAYFDGVHSAYGAYPCQSIWTLCSRMCVGIPSYLSPGARNRHYARVACRYITVNWPSRIKKKHFSCLPVTFRSVNTPLPCVRWELLFKVFSIRNDFHPLHLYAVARDPSPVSLTTYRMFRRQSCTIYT